MEPEKSVVLYTFDRKGVERGYTGKETMYSRRQEHVNLV